MESPVGTIVSICDSRARVEVASTAVCARCAAGRGCGAGIVTGGRLTTIEVELAQDLAALPGDRVLLSLDPADLLRASLLAYGLPLFSTAAALVLLRLFTGVESDLIALGTAFTGLVAGLFAGRLLLLRSRRCARTLVPTIRRVATAAEAAEPST